MNSGEHFWGTSMDSLTHKILDILQHLWPYVSGLFITLAAGARLWWLNYKRTEQRISNVETLAEQAVTEKRLQQCKAEVFHHDAGIEEKILKEIRSIRDEIHGIRHETREDFRSNSEAHEHILDTILKLHHKGDP